MVVIFLRLGGAVRKAQELHELQAALAAVAIESHQWVEKIKFFAVGGGIAHVGEKRRHSPGMPAFLLLRVVKGTEGFGAVAFGEGQGEIVEQGAEGTVGSAGGEGGEG